MIQASRTAYTEQPDGSLTCHITIAAADRLRLLNGEAIELPGKPGNSKPWWNDDAEVMALADRCFSDATKEHAADIDHLMLQAVTSGTGILNTSHSASDGVDVQAVDPLTVTFHNEAEPAADRPPTQTVDAGGFEASAVMAAVAQGEYAWNHPAAPHVGQLYRHAPFQRFARENTANADAFSAPMELASRLLMQQSSMGALEALMAHYMNWAGMTGDKLWPES